MTRHLSCIPAIITVEGWARSRWIASIMMDEDGDNSQGSCGNLAIVHSAMTPLVVFDKIRALYGSRKYGDLGVCLAQGLWLLKSFASHIGKQATVGSPPHRTSMSEATAICRELVMPSGPGHQPGTFLLCLPSLPPRKVSGPNPGDLFVASAEASEDNWASPSSQAQCWTLTRSRDSVLPW